MRSIRVTYRAVFEQPIGDLNPLGMTTCRSFEKQVQDWQLWGMAPGNGITDLSVERMLTPYDVADLGNGQFGWIQDEDRTHILHGPLIDPKAKIPNAACGAKVNVKCFISTKANVEPTCKGCAEVWKKEYRNK
jgi:hypothetical protein